ncbi:hypothetical protein BDW22DRAFT_1348460 [Trametopsis cervina]|nr:hypothetical protein BDW22DRAFT_1348460 [Trametopsis cervina]
MNSQGVQMSGTEWKGKHEEKAPKDSDRNEINSSVSSSLTRAMDHIIKHAGGCNVEKRGLRATARGHSGPASIAPAGMLVVRDEEHHGVRAGLETPRHRVVGSPPHTTQAPTPYLLCACFCAHFLLEAKAAQHRRHGADTGCLIKHDMCRPWHALGTGSIANRIPVLSRSRGAPNGLGCYSRKYAITAPPYLAPSVFNTHNARRHVR